MTSLRFAKIVARLIETRSFTNSVAVDRVADEYLVWFEVVTTKTRASSIVTRICLIIQEVDSGCHVRLVHKRLVGDNPKDRSSLTTWMICVVVKIRKGAANARLRGRVHQPRNV